MALSLMLALLPGVLPQDGELAQAPGDRDARLDPELRAELEAWSPLIADWDTERRAAQVSEQLAALGRAALAGATPDAALFASVCAETFAGAALRGPLVTLRTGAFVVQSGGASSAPDVRGRDALLAELTALRRALFADAPYVRVKFKVDAIEERDDELVTGVRVELAAGGAAQVGAYWRLTWTVSSDAEPPLLAGLVRERHREVTRPSGGPLLVEAGHTVFGGDAYERQLLPGLESWRARLDAGLGVGTLGHHGLALGDVDGDGLEDVYLCQPGGLPNRLYRHTSEGGSEEVAAACGVDFYEVSTAALFVHLDDDGRHDLVVAAGGELVFLRNVGGRFVVAARHPAPHTTSLSAADVEGDGDLDVYACAYLSPYDGLGTPLPYHDANNGAANTLFANLGGFEFVDATAVTGLDANNRRFSFAAAWEDFDNDGDQDVYVANDFGRNNLYRNDGGWFVDVAAELGVEDISAGMGVTWSDVDGDGWMDLYVSNMFSAAGGRVAYQRRFRAGADDAERASFQRHARGNSLFLNRGGDGFEDASESSGTGMGRWAWGAIFADLDDDGHEDLLVPNGFVTGERADDL